MDPIAGLGSSFLSASAGYHWCLGRSNHIPGMPRPETVASRRTSRIPRTARCCYETSMHSRLGMECGRASRDFRGASVDLKSSVRLLLGDSCLEDGSAGISH